MATISVGGHKLGSGALYDAMHSPVSANLCTAKATDGVSTNVIDRGGVVSNPVLLKFNSTGTGAAGVGTQTYLIEGSPDNTNWFPASYSSTATPDTWGVTTFTDAVANNDVVWYIVKPALPYRYLRVTLSATTTRNATIDAFVF
jgi:hypothetical protein